TGSGAATVRSPREPPPLTSFTWGCSSESKKLRSQFLTYRVADGSGAVPRRHTGAMAPIPRRLTRRSDAISHRVEFRVSMLDTMKDSLSATRFPLDMGSIAPIRFLRRGDP